MSGLDNYTVRQNPKPVVTPTCNKASEIPQEVNLAIIRVANHRDKKALAELADFFANRIFAFALTKVGDEQSAKEIVQDTLFAIWNKAATYNQDKGNVSTWVYTIARNLCFDLGRKRLSRPQLVNADVVYHVHEDENTDEIGDVERSLDHQKLSALLATLPSAQREVVELVYLREYSHQAAAEHLNLPVGTVKSRLRLAMEKLHSMVDKKVFGYE
ncbi:sigma-70 family RNA polymerase sigma factor [Flocculibacter collagenilyticus]|uniref:sigma-70 family RNA polymerase sigma factor n=1 Tax=Flocculibacter collagenilyticus TaxID=2744479 RepID=UPI0018F48F88|nr:sigma-70 family RNA polymerase sigma factor [Flocculibacter collagenilyticus]